MEVYDLIDIELKKSIVQSNDYNPTELQDLLENVYDEIYKCQNEIIIRKSISKLSNIFHAVGDSSLVVLMYVFINKLKDIDGVKILKHTYVDAEPVLDKLVDYIESDIIKNNGQFSFFNHKKGETTLGKKKLYATILEMLKGYLRNTGSKEDLDFSFVMILLINMWEIASKIDRLHEFYIIYCSCLHKLHLNKKTPMVRDLAEGLIDLGVKNKTLHYSFYVRTAVYARQFNVIDSLLSAHLMMHGYKYTHKENEIFISKQFLELLILLRNFRLFPYAEQVKKTRDQLHINDRYDNHQFDMAIFNMRLMMNDEDLIKSVNQYLAVNDVLEFDVSSGIPWIVLLLNLKSRNPAYFEENNNLSESLNRLEDYEDISKSDLIVNFKKGMSNLVIDNKQEVQQYIANILQSRSFVDVNYELTMFQPIVKNLLRNAIQSFDYEGILIAHSLLSGPLGFEINTTEPSLELAPLNEGVNLPSPTIFNEYLKHITRLIDESAYSTFLWIGCCDEFCYSVCLKDRQFSLYKNDNFSRNVLREWESSQTELLAFNDRPYLASILDSEKEYWHRESCAILESLPVLTDLTEAKNIILFRDINISYLPPNLTKTSAGKILADLAPIHIPSTVEMYLKGKPYKLDYNNIKLWAPIEEGDYAINIAYDKIESLISDDSMEKVTSLDPRVDLNKEINIFISHGGKDSFYGFKSISPAEGKYYIKEKDIFGKGKVAILFICHSGSSKSAMFATKLDGLVSKVLDLGYECVLAPAWSYNVTLTGIWTRSFLDALKDGGNLSASTYSANAHVKSLYPGIGAYAAMHLFGNDKLV